MRKMGKYKLVFWIFHILFRLSWKRDASTFILTFLCCGKEKGEKALKQWARTGKKETREKVNQHLWFGENPLGFSAKDFLHKTLFRKNLYDFFPLREY